MGAQGIALLDFGTAGAPDAAVAVTGQSGIAGSSLVEAWLLPSPTADHSADEHLIEGMDVIAGAIVAGTGFTIYGRSRNTILRGRWTVAWVWN